MRIYIAGPITGMVDHNRAAFARAERVLVACGHTPLNPLRLSPFVEGKPWEDYMVDDLAVILRHAEGIALLPGWDKSRGARVEEACARALGLRVRGIGEWVELATAERKDRPIPEFVAVA